MKDQHILVVSGNYEVVTRVQTALGDSPLLVDSAFSHRDALYMLEHEAIDLALIDGAMFDRRTGDYTISELRRFSSIPMILIALEGVLGNYSQPPVELVIGALDRSTIYRSVMAVLGHTSAPATQSSSAYASEVQTLFSLGKSLTEVLDLSEVLNRVVEAARHLTSAEEGMILLPDGDVGQLWLRARVGIDDDVARNFRIKTDDSLAGQVFQSGEPVLVGAQGPQKVKTQYFVNSLLYVPILLKGQPIGVLGVNNKTSDAEFDDGHIELLMNLASYAAIAIENARIHEETLQRTRELQSLVEASEVVSASVALSETLPNICQQLAQVLNVGWAAILEWEPESDQLRMMARYLRNFWRVGHGHPLETWEQVADLEYFRVDRDDAQHGNRNHEIERLGVDTILGVSVRAESQLLGVVRAFFVDAPEQHLTREAVHHVAHLGMEGLMTVLNTDDHEAAGHLFRLLDDVNQYLGADWSELALCSAAGDDLTIQAAVGAGVWLHDPFPLIDLADYPDLWAVVAQQQVFSRQVDDGDRHNQQFLKMMQSHAVLGLPLVQRGQIQGVVLFGDTRFARSFTEREIDLGRAIVGQAATALENARLVHSLERSVRELQDTQDRMVQTARLTAMGELAAAVAHQINNPLTTILVDTELMLLDEPEESRNYRSLLAISRAGKRAASVVRRLLATARPSEENAPVEPVDVVDSIEGILSLVRPHIEQDHIQVYSRLPQQQLPPVWAVQGQLDDIWLNLLLNAHDALIGQAGAEIGIELSFQPDDPYIQVEVWDNGPGIPAVIQPDIFKPFFTTKPVGEGTGLGLHICSQVIEHIQGSIAVESAEGKGTRFFVRLPVKKGSA